MKEELKAKLKQRIAAIFDNINAVGAALEGSDGAEILKWVDAQISEPTSEDDESLAYAISSLGDNLIDYGKEFNRTIQ